MNFDKNKNYITLEGVMYEVNFCNITNRQDGGLNVNFYNYDKIMKNKGLLKDLLHYNISLTSLSNALLRNGLRLSILESVDNINIFEVKYITKSTMDLYKPIDFENLCNDKVEVYEKN